MRQNQRREGQAYQGLVTSIGARTVERVTRDNVTVGREILLERVDLWLLARGLASDDGAHLGGRGVQGSNLVNIGSLYAVHDPVAGSGHEMAIAEDLNIALGQILSTCYRDWNDELQICTLLANSPFKLS